MEEFIKWLWNLNFWWFLLIFILIGIGGAINPTTEQKHNINLTINEKEEKENVK